MAVAQRMSEADYVEFINSGVDGVWELHDGRLVEKPGMSWDHGRIITKLILSLGPQLDPEQHVVFTELRIRRTASTILLPDLMVVPTTYGEYLRNRPILAIFSEPLPLVVEVWSPSTGRYDVRVKLAAYRDRGDAEVWRVHPFERTLTRWLRQEDGSYAELVHTGGAVDLVGLPGVTIDLDALFGT